MAFEKGKSGNPFGKPKGAVNKTTLQAKEAIQAAFDGIGGTDALIKWAKDPKNQGLFYSSIYPKILPMQLSGSLEIKVPALVELPAKKKRD